MTTPRTHVPDPASTAGTSPAQVAGAWLFVLIPLAWGVAQVVARSLQLFK